VRVTTSEFIRGYGALADKALTEPVTITSNGRDRLVLLSVDEYERLRRRDRRAFRAEELSEADLELIAQAKVPAEYAHLDEELGDWQP
jgi:PHD/YefM family antitoxin component YafN of YafNO toxin-antitoxin module